MFKKVLVIKNPTSANGRKLKFIDRVVENLIQQSCKVEVYETKAPGDAIAFLLTYSEPVDVVVAAGGDGTINEVVNGLKGKQIPLAIIPAGTTNVLAKELSLPKKPQLLANIIINGLPKPVYLGSLNGRRFTMMVGIGYDAWVVNNVNLNIKKRFGKLAYVISMLKEVFHYGKQNFLAEIDGRQVSVGSMIITQGRYYAGSFVLSRRADLSHPYLQAVVISTENKWKFLLSTFALPLGLMESMPAVQSISAKEIKIKCKPGDDGDSHLAVLQVDGDPAGKMPAVIKIEEQAISILVAS